MPIQAYRCPKGHEFSILVGMTMDEDPDLCPQCQTPVEECERLIGGGVRRIPGRKRTLDDLSPEQRANIDVELGYETKAEYDEMAEQILSGELTLDESRTVEEFRPEVPEHLRKNYHFIPG